MTSQSNSVLTSSLKSFSRASSFIVILVGCLVLVGWAFDIMALKSVLPGLVTMKANTALAFVLLGMSLWLLQSEQADQRMRRIAQAYALAVTFLGLLTFSEYLFGLNLGIDQLLFKEPPEAAGPFPPDRMTFATALNFFLLASALLLLDVEKRGIHYFSQSLTLIVGLISLLSLGGYIYNDPALIGGFSYTRMSLHTAPTFIVLCSGILCARPDRGLMVVIASDTTGGLLARRLLPAAIVVPLLLAWLRLEGERAGLYSLEFGLALFALSNVVVISVIVLWNARLIERAETERRGEAAKFQTLVESSPDSIVTTDRNGSIVFVNSRTEKTFGYSRNELLGKPVELLIPERYRQRHMQDRGAYIVQPHPRPMGTSLELYGRRKDGGDFPVDISLSPLETEDGLLVTSTIRDITERKQAEEQAQRNLERIRALHEMDLAITSTLELPRTLDIFLDKLVSLLPYPTVPTVSLWNREAGKLEPAACRNIDKEEWIAHYAEREHGVGYTKLALESKTFVMSRNLQADPNTRHPGFVRRHGLVSYLVIPLIAKEETLGMLGLYTKEEHEFSNEEVEFLTTLAGQAAIAIHNAKLYGDLRTSSDALERSNKVKDEFLSVMSHELRTPLNVVMGYAGMIKDGLLGDINPQQEEALDKVINRANDQLTMINNVLYATVIETGKVKAEMVEVDLGDFLGQLRTAYHGPINKNLTLTWDYPPDLPTIKTDSAKLKQTLKNLIDNAIKFTEKGNVMVSARIRHEATGIRQQEEHVTSASSLAPSDPHGSRLPPRSTEAHDRSHVFVELKVADTGVGISKEHLPIIFERFRQADSSETRLFGGVGMGLYIVKKLTELLRGKVEVESEPGEGSTFRVRIPWES